MKTIMPLKGLLVLEFCQYLSGPSAGLRLADLGARVIKIERPGKGDMCRQLSIKDLWIDESSLLFHTINRNKESFVADLKNNEDLELVKKLILKADVVTHNFRPFVMEKIGLDYNSVRKINPRVVYGEITGYGKKGPWKNKPGQDLLIQSLSGLTYTTGNAGANPVPFGLSVADLYCGNHLVQGVLAALVRRLKTGTGAYVEVSLMESVIDFQFELMATYFNGGGQPKRSQVNNAQPLLGAPYGIYKTGDGHIALAMIPLSRLADSLGCDALKAFDEKDKFSKRDEIKSIIADFLVVHTNDYWMARLTECDIWAMPVMDWNEMVGHDAYKAIKIEQEIIENNGKKWTTTRCPFRINDQILYSRKPSPRLGADTAAITSELNLNTTV